MTKSIRITYSDGSTSKTDINPLVDWADVERYFLGQVFVEECQHTGQETKRRCIKIEAL